MAVVSLHNIKKTYGKPKDPVLALKDISFEVSEGALFGLIGPDGAGKTSLFRILTTLLLADSGTASVNGYDVVKQYKEIRRSIGYMPGRFSLYQDLTVAENLQFFATIFNTTVQENYSLIKDIYTQIEPFKDRRAGKLSGGMKQKLALSCALIHRPSILLLDEPTTGVDAVSRKEFWEMLRSLKKEGITILVSTPYMDEAALCDKVALIQKGEILSINTPAGIVESFGKPLYAIKGANMIGLLKLLQENSLIDSVYPSGVYHHLIPRNAVSIQEIVSSLEAKGQKNMEWKVITPNVEDCFIDLMRITNNGQFIGNE